MAAGGITQNQTASDAIKISTGDTVDDIGHETQERVQFTHKYRTGLTTRELEDFKNLDKYICIKEFWIGFSVFLFFKVKLTIKMHIQEG